MSVMKKLDELTYVVEHSPNCPDPFLVRLVGRGAGGIDHEPPGKTKDVLGYGKTMEEAAEAALNKKRSIVSTEMAAERERKSSVRVDS